MKLFISVGLLSMSRCGSGGLLVSGDVGGGGCAFAPWRPPCLSGLRNGEAALHEVPVRIALEVVGPLLKLQHEALRPGESHAGEDAVDAESAQVEVVNARAVA